MAKVMLVEDDNNLREIYEARLAAEGYEIVSAADGEAALALAIKEKPDLIISDIMMPKVSGFDMLDILRSTTETKNTKIIMMTALNQAEDKARAEKLGADVYLVKSQVTLEDVVRSAKNLLGEETPLSVGGIPVQAPATTAPTTAQTTTSLSANAPAVATPAPAVQTAPAATPAAPPATPTPATPVPVAVAPEPAPTPPAPVTTPAPTAEAKPTTQSDPLTASSTMAEEEAALQKQIEQYVKSDAPPAANAPAVATPAPAVQTAPAATPAAPPATPTPATPVPVAVAPEPAPTPPAPVTTPAPTAEAKPQSSMAQPPSSLTANTPASDGDPGEDRPAGEQVIVKSASANGQEPGIDASVSGRKKVIQPISDVLTKGPNLDALIAKEGEASGDTPTLNTVITPDGMTLSATNGTPTMNDVIAPSPQASKEQAPQQPLPPPVA